ncbi:MAG: helix-turn-helix transcriptional regulator [Rhodospirillaceae bacterium]|nr:helix-turn-helix transcriptional regulator [Rhodospirillaceae bacterium]
MAATIIFRNADLKVTDYRCQAGPADRPFTEMHEHFSAAFVRRGSFGYRHRGRTADLVPGAVLLGHPGDEYVCTHEHHACGDACLNFQLSPAYAEMVGGDKAIWQAGSVAPHGSLMVLGALAEAVAEGRSDLGFDEIGLMFTAAIARHVAGRPRAPVEARSQDRAKITAAAAWIEDHAGSEIDLAQVATVARMSPFHFLRLFARIAGVTPHQYLIGARLRLAATLLAGSTQPITDIAYDVGFGDLSNFVRTFHRAARMSPRRFRQQAQGRLGRQGRKNLQDRLPASLVG